MAPGGWLVAWTAVRVRAPVPRLANGKSVDAIDAVELALADYEAMFGHPMVDDCTDDTEAGEVLPVVTILTDNGGPFRSFRFEAFIAAHAELHHVRTRVRTPGQNGSRERGFGTLKDERLFIDEIDDAIMLAKPPRTTRSNTTRSGPRSGRLEPAHRGAPGPRRPDHPDISNHQDPANYLTRDTLTHRQPHASGRMPDPADHPDDTPLRGSFQMRQRID